MPPPSDCRISAYYQRAEKTRAAEVERVVLNAFDSLGGLAAIIWHRLRRSRSTWLLFRCAVLLQRGFQNFIDVFHRDEFEFLFRFLGNVDEIFFVELGNDDSGNSGAHRSQTLFFQSADRQN